MDRSSRLPVCERNAQAGGSSPAQAGRSPVGALMTGI